MLLRGELIGLDVEVVDAMNKSNVGLKGIVVDERREMVQLDNGKKLLKGQCVFRFRFGGRYFVVDGRRLVGRPEDRLKKVRRIFER